jgi:hypothetical protein
MNPKIFVFAAVLALGAILGGILLGGPTMVIPSQDNIPGPQNILEAKPLQIELDDISVESISERTATIKIAFEVYSCLRLTILTRNKFPAVKLEADLLEW